MIESARRKKHHASMHAARDRSHFLRKRERRREKCSSSPRKSVNVGKVRVEGRLRLRVKGRVMVRVCLGLELQSV